MSTFFTNFPPAALMPPVQGYALSRAASVGFPAALKVLKFRLVDPGNFHEVLLQAALQSSIRAPTPSFAKM